MTQWGIDTLFNPGKRHMDEEKRRLQSTREEVGDSSGGRRIDFESGTVTISRRGTNTPPAGADEAESDEAEPTEAELVEAEADHSDETGADHSDEAAAETDETAPESDGTRAASATGESEAAGADEPR